MAANAAVSNGARKVTSEVDNPQLENKLLSEWNDPSGTLPHDRKHTRPFAWRLINIHYTPWMGGVENIHLDNGFRVTTEAVLRIGTW